MNRSKRSATTARNSEATGKTTTRKPSSRGTSSRGATGPEAPAGITAATGATRAAIKGDAA